MTASTAQVDNLISLLMDTQRKVDIILMSMYLTGRLL